MSDFNLGTVTAYGYAKDKGYTGTEAEFAELMASYADVAEQAAESATQAAASATTATAKASEAAQSATAAASSKTAAETAQGGAETAAQTATTKAGEASASATTASGKATEATTAAGTATTKASEATTAATTATTKAGEASTSATNAAASATRAQEILDSIPEDYSQMSEDVADLKDGLDAVETQLEQTTVEALSAYATDTASGAIASFPDGADGVPVKSLTVDIEPVQSGSGDPSPDNVRPISGHTQAVVTRTGKNLFDSSVFPETATQTILYIHYAVKNGAYTMSTPDFPLVSGIANVYFLTGAVSSGASSGSNGVSQSAPRTITVTDGYYTVAYRSTNDINTNNPKNFKWQIESGNSESTYEPYNGQTVIIDLGQTVYGGTLDVTTGVLTVDKQMVDLGTLSWTYNNRCMVSGVISPSGSVGAVGSSNNVVCSSYKARPTRNYTTSYDNGMCGLTISGTQIIARDDNYTDPSTFKASASGVQFAYELATPQTIQLSAQEVRTLLAENNIFADCGNTTVEYRADTKLYIQKVINS